MTNPALKTLFHPFEAGELVPPRAGARVLFLGAEPGFRLPAGFDAAIEAVQGFRPDVLALSAAGIETTPQPSGTGFDAALVLAGRHRGLNERRIADALERTAPGALLLVAGGKEDGVASLRKRVSGLATVEGQMPKFHGLAFWLHRPADPASIVAALRAANPPLLVDGRFRTAPGMFSHDRVDAGSALLAAHLPAALAGSVADFCAGWGYLAASVLDRCPKVEAIDLFEADWAALEAARANLAGRSARIGFFWHDLLGETVTRRYDAVVMNPPYHRGRAADPALGMAMIGKAAAALRRGGRLLMVANRQLPYEAILATAFARFEEIARDRDFKLLAAVAK